MLQGFPYSSNSHNPQRIIKLLNRFYINLQDRNTHNISDYACLSDALQKQMSMQAGQQAAKQALIKSELQKVRKMGQTLASSDFLINLGGF